jgi:hypothetical protein
MPGVFTLGVENQAIATADTDVDLIEITPADDHPVEVFGIQIFFTTEVQEAQEEWARLAIVRGHTTSGNGTSLTAIYNVDEGADAASFTAESYATTPASAGTGVNVMPFAVNVRAGYEIFLPEGCGIKARGTSLLCLRLLAALADAASATFVLWVKEH